MEGALTAEYRAKLLEVGQKCPGHRTLKSGVHVTAVGLWSGGGLTTKNGIASAGGAKSARFKDTEGNMLAIVQSLR